MGLFDKAFNKFAEAGNKLNNELNKAMGKKVFGDIRPIEPPREYADYSSFPPYEKDEPENWSSMSGEEKVFMLSGETIHISKELDICMQYRKLFSEAASFYTERFKYKYSLCVNDFDTLTHYFNDMYLEGLNPMLYRAYSLFLPLGLIDIDVAAFIELHTSLFKRAITSWATMCGIEESINQKAQNTGETVGGAIRLRGGGFGLRGAAKGIAKAEAFNIGMNLIGKFVSHQMKMTPEQKAAAFGAFKKDLFFSEVYSDYFNTFLTLIEVLAQEKVINDVKIITDDKAATIIKNLKNPMFPKDLIPQSLAKLISTYPFEPKCYDLAEELLGSSEVLIIKDYFLG